MPTMYFRLRVILVKMKKFSLTAEEKFIRNKIFQEFETLFEKYNKRKANTTVGEAMSITKLIKINSAINVYKAFQEFKQYIKYGKRLYNFYKQYSHYFNKALQNENLKHLTLEAIINEDRFEKDTLFMKNLVNDIVKDIKLNV